MSYFTRYFFLSTIFKLCIPESFWSLAPDCLLVLCSEFFVDWIKHAFITRFNEVSAEVYKDYTIHLAYDLAQTKQTDVSSTEQPMTACPMSIYIPLYLLCRGIAIIPNYSISTSQLAQG